jgi:hypothetical protein
MQYLDPGAFDKSKLNQPSLEFTRSQIVIVADHADRLNPAGEPYRGGTERYGAVRETRTGGHGLSPVVCPINLLRLAFICNLAASPAPS